MIIKRNILSKKFYTTSVSTKVIGNVAFETDSFTNVTPKIVSHLKRNFHNEKEHPIGLLKERIVQFFYNTFKGGSGNPLFSVYDDLSPVVTIQQNFDSLLIPENHPARAKSDSYYINKDWLLRTHMTAHQSDLMKMGLNNYLMAGDVYRRDTIDQTHYPVFHQLDGVRLLTPEELFTEIDDGIVDLGIKEKRSSQRTKDKQEVYTLTATKMVGEELKKTLENLSEDLFGPEVQYKWTEAYFPFTHPSWELNVLLDDKWIEMLGCGIMEHGILEKAGCSERIGWAFGLGLERLAMLYYSIPDIRIFWSKDPGFLHQFEGKSCMDKIKYKPVSIYPPCPFDISFWISENFCDNDFYECARENSGDLIEQISLIDTYKCKKTGRESRCYRIVYRSMEKTLTTKELQGIHKELEKKVVDLFKVQIR